MLKSFRRNGWAIGTCIACVLSLTVAWTAVAEDAPINNSAKAPTTQDVAAIDPSAPNEKPTAVTGDASPQLTIEAFHAGLLGIMKDAKQLGFQGRIDRLEPLMARTFDLEFMASKTVGGHWRKLSDADKKRWTALFSRITVANYAGRFTGFAGEKFVTTNVEEAKRGQQLVLTKIVLPKDEDVQLNYRLRKTKSGWKVIDVYLNGTVSELALRRSEYSTALKREGFEELIASIETKIADLKAKGLVDG